MVAYRLPDAVPAILIGGRVFSLSLEGEGWGEGGCPVQQPTGGELLKHPRSTEQIQSEEFRPP